MEKSLLDFIQSRGIIIFDDVSEDFDLNDYILDSLAFIKFVVELEDYFGITFPDELLVFDVLASYVGLNNIIIELVKSKNNVNLTKNIC